jgi:hypothetical protein
MTEGEKFKAALEEWMSSPEGAKCRAGEASGFYLENRLYRAFDAGWEAAKRTYAAPSGIKEE